jgi:hypothetical protein
MVGILVAGIQERATILTQISAFHRRRPIEIAVILTRKISPLMATIRTGLMATTTA